MSTTESDPIHEEALSKIRLRITKAILEITVNINEEPQKQATLHHIGELCYVAHQLEDIADSLLHRGKWAI